MILLILCALLAGECKVHRQVPPYWKGDVKVVNACMFIVDRDGTERDSCIVQSHYIPCTVVEKCDTVWCRTYEFGDKFTAVYRVYVECHPETTLVDSGVVEDGWWFSVPDGKTDIRKPAEDDTLWIFDTPFLRSEMPDLKEMLREWRERRLKDSINTAQHAIHKVCPKCGDCKPRESMMVACTAMGCSSGCCNACTYTFYCAKTDDEFTVTINECDWIVWDGGGK